MKKALLLLIPLMIFISCEDEKEDLDAFALGMPSFSPADLDFGTVPIGSSVTDSITVSNAGSGSLATMTISAVTSTSAAFVVTDPSPITLAGGASANIPVVYTATAESAESGDIVFTHDGASSPDSVHVTGAGVSAFVGTWDLTFMGEYENSDCTGSLDSTDWALAQAFGFTATMILNDDGTVEMTVYWIVLDETETETGTWSENSDGTSLTINGESQNVSMASDGNSFSATAMDDAYCEDSYTYEETSSTDSTSCQAAGNYWIDASCSYMEYTKQ